MDNQENQNHTEPEVNPHIEISNKLTVTQPGEHTIFELKRHPIGILGIYVMTGFLLVVLGVLAFVVTPHFISGRLTVEIGALVFLIISILCIGFVYASSRIYWANSWILTTDSLTQVEQDGMFKRQSSQLSLASIEDVTAEQYGIFPKMFKYGWLRVETAGERSKFVFQYCPNPNYYAQQVLQAREAYEGHRLNEQQAGVPGYGSYNPPQVTEPEPETQPETHPESKPELEPNPVPETISETDSAATAEKSNLES